MVLQFSAQALLELSSCYTVSKRLQYAYHWKTFHSLSKFIKTTCTSAYYNIFWNSIKILNHFIVLYYNISNLRDHRDIIVRIEIA